MAEIRIKVFDLSERSILNETVPKSIMEQHDQYWANNLIRFGTKFGTTKCIKVYLLDPKDAPTDFINHAMILCHGYQCVFNKNTRLGALTIQASNWELGKSELQLQFKIIRENSEAFLIVSSDKPNITFSWEAHSLLETEKT